MESETRGRVRRRRQVSGSQTLSPPRGYGGQPGPLLRAHAGSPILRPHSPPWAAGEPGHDIPVRVPSTPGKSPGPAPRSPMRPGLPALVTWTCWGSRAAHWGLMAESKL